MPLKDLLAEDATHDKVHACDGGAEPPLARTDRAREE